MGWICVRCDARLSMSSGNLVCDRCRHAFPIVGEVPVLTAYPSLYLRGTKLRFIAHRLNLTASRQILLRQYAADPRTERARLTIEAHERNQLLVEHLCFSKLENISLHAEGPATSFVQPGIGWSAEDLVPYFCVDWIESNARRNIVGHVLSAVERCHNFDKAVILGSGSGRLLADLANHFNSVTGIDLSLSALILSRHLLKGGQLELSLDRAGWRAVTLLGSQQPPSNVHLAAADVAALPFASSSLSFVVTQYLLDIIPDPARVAHEINRVLETGGIWFNFGLPFHLVSDPPLLARWKASEMGAFLPIFGFQPFVIQEEILHHLDLTNFDAAAIGDTHRAVLFSARKVAGLASDTAVSAFHKYFGGKDDLVLGLVPRICNRQRLSISLTKSIGNNGETSLEEIRLGDRGDRIQVEPLTRNVIEQIWRAVNGKRNICEIIGIARASFGEDIKEKDIIAIIQKLMESGVIELAPGS